MQRCSRWSKSRQTDVLQAGAVESVLGDKYGVKDAANPSPNDPIQARASLINDEPTTGNKSLLQVNIGNPTNGVNVNISASSQTGSRLRQLKFHSCQRLSATRFTFDNAGVLLILNSSFRR